MSKGSKRNWIIFIGVVAVASAVMGVALVRFEALIYGANLTIVHSNNSDLARPLIFDTAEDHPFQGTETYQGFTVEVPTGWKIRRIEEGAVLRKSTSKIFILPKGGLGHGLPFYKPAETTIFIDGKRAKRKKWILNEGNDILVIIKIIDYPRLTWNEENIIEVYGTKEDEIVLDSLINNITLLTEDK